MYIEKKRKIQLPYIWELFLIHVEAKVQGNVVLLLPAICRASGKGHVASAEFSLSPKVRISRN